MSHRIEAPHLGLLYQLACQRFAERPAFASHGPDGNYLTTTFAQLYESGIALATGLIDLGLQAREKVGLIADNRYEWIVSDFGVLLSGAADVPRATDITEAEMQFILTHSDSKMVILENTAVLAAFERVRSKVPGIRQVILMDGRESPGAGVLTLDGLIRRGRELRREGDRRAEERIASISPDDLFTVIYTSGTTGTPKGVPLTHANMVSQVRNLPFEIFPGERTLSILPVWHSYERVFEMVAIANGACTYYTSIRKFGEDLKKVRPNVMASAPRLWESLHSRILAQVRQGGVARRVLFSAAVFCNRRVRMAGLFFAGQQIDVHGRKLPETLALAVMHLVRWLVNVIPAHFLNSLVLSRLREAMGCGDFRGTISGGGALQPHVDEFFNSIGIPVLEGYGLTETCPVLAVRTWKRLVIGTVGPMYPGTRVRIVDINDGRVLYPGKGHGRGRGRQGEIQVRGPQVMSGYYKSPELTAAVFDDGWFKTGDLGLITFNDCLKIVGRCKDTIVLLNGENVEPVPIEHQLSASPLIDQCMVTGQDKKNLGALIVPDLESFHEAGLHEPNLTALIANPQTSKMIDAEIRQRVGAHTGFKPFERITTFALIGEPFRVGHELTNTLKLKRHVISEKYRNEIGSMHSE